MTGLPEPPEPASLDGFPSIVWAAQQPLWRVHRESNPTVHFARGAAGRFNPPAPDSDYGTWYLSSHPRGAFVEVFGRFQVITRAQVNERVLASVHPPSDLRLANLTDPTVVGRFGLTNELSVGGEDVYPIAQRWSAALRQAGFGGVHYAARHDPTLQSRSIALFGKPTDQGSLDDAVVLQPLEALAEEMADYYGWTVISGRPL